MALRVTPRLQYFHKMRPYKIMSFRNNMLRSEGERANDFYSRQFMQTHLDQGLSQTVTAHALKYLPGNYQVSGVLLSFCLLGMTMGIFKVLLMTRPDLVQGLPHVFSTNLFMHTTGATMNWDDEKSDREHMMLDTARSGAGVFRVPHDRTQLRIERFKAAHVKNLALNDTIDRETKAMRIAME